MAYGKILSPTVLIQDENTGVNRFQNIMVNQIYIRLTFSHECVVTSHIVDSLKLVIMCWIPKLIFERRSSSSIFFLISIEIKKRVLFRGNRDDAVLGTPDSFSGEIIFIIITRSTSRQRGNFFKTDDDSNSLLRVNFRRRKFQGKPHMCLKIKSTQNLIR